MEVSDKSGTVSAKCAFSPFSVYFLSVTPIETVSENPMPAGEISDIPDSSAIISLSGRDLGNCDLKYICFPTKKITSRSRTEVDMMAADLHFLYDTPLLPFMMADTACLSVPLSPYLSLSDSSFHSEPPMMVTSSSYLSVVVISESLVRLLFNSICQFSFQPVEGFLGCVQLYLRRVGRIEQYQVTLYRIDQVDVVDIDDETPSYHYEGRSFRFHLFVDDCNEFLSVEPQLLPESSREMHAAIVAFRFDVYDIGRADFKKFCTAVGQYEFFHHDRSISQIYAEAENNANLKISS